MLIFSRIYHDIHVLRTRAAYIFSELFSHRFVVWYLAFSMFLNIGIWFFCWLFYRQVREDVIILHYNVDFGVDLVGSPEKVFVIPGLGLFVIVFNLVLLSVFVKRQDFKMLANMSLIAALLVNAFLSLSLGPLYIINFS
jgi:hypothetical protein